MLPGLDGLEITRRLRARNSYTPLLMLTSRATEVDRVLGLEMGADDYLTKPFSVLELRARVKAIFRRMEQMPANVDVADEIVEAGPLRIDSKSRTVRSNGAPVDLTAREFDLLLFFARNAGRVYTREQLLNHVWGYNHSGYEHTVNSHINRLRAKIECDPGDPQMLQTVWGVGYKFNKALAKKCRSVPADVDAGAIGLHRQRGVLRGKAKGKTRSCARHAFGGDIARVQFEDALGNRQTQPGAPSSRAPTLVHLVEAVKYER